GSLMVCGPMVAGALRPSDPASRLCPCRGVAQRGASMVGRGIKPVLFVCLCLLAGLISGQARAGGFGAVADAYGERSALVLPAHFKKTQSFYCYPKNYWWFYRPYTTASQNNARCMPYFHYLDEGAYYQRGDRPDRTIK